MRSSSWILAVGLAAQLMGMTGLHAGSTSINETARIEQLIARLGSSQFVEREQATRDLDALGTAALEAIREAARSDDPEIARRAEQLRVRIEKRVEAAQMLQPKRIRISYQDTLVKDAVADLARKTAYPIALEGDLTRLSERRITLDTGELPFWEAFDQFVQKAGLIERPQPAAPRAEDAHARVLRQQQMILRSRRGGTSPVDNRLVLQDGHAPRVPTFHAGAVRVRALPAHPNAPTSRTPQDDLIVHLDVQAEPALQWQGIIDVRVDRAVDDQGQSLARSFVFGGTGMDPESLMELQLIMMLVEDDMGRPEPNRQSMVRLKPGTRPSRKIAELQGTAAVQLQSALQPLIQVTNILKAAGASARGIDGSFLKVMEVNRQATGAVSLRVQIDSPSPTPGVIVWGGGRFVRRVGARSSTGDPGPAAGLALLDGKDQAYQLVGTDLVMAANNGNQLAHEYRLTFYPRAGQGEAAKLVWSGRRTVTLDVPFTLKDIPLP